MSVKYATQNDILQRNLTKWYSEGDRLSRMLSVINGESQISLRIVDWFATNYAKKHWTSYDLTNKEGDVVRFKVYRDYKLKLNAYSKRRFDPFCRWERIYVPIGDGKCIQTTLGQLNFFKWAIENKVLEYIENNYDIVDKDMNGRNSNSKKRTPELDSNGKKTRKKREELSICASKSIKKEYVKIRVKFS